MPVNAPRRSHLLMIGSIAVALGATACASAAPGPSPSSLASGQITATLSEWKIELSAPTAPGGPVAFAVTNQGAIAHEFLLIRTDMMAGSLPVINNMIDVNAMGGPMGSGGMGMPGMSPAPNMEHPVGTVGVIDEIAADATAQLTIADLAAGHYVIVCDLPAHYEQGMRIDFTVL